MYAESKNGCVCFEGNSSIATQCVSPSPTTSSQAIQATSSLNLFAGVFSSSGSTTTQFSIGSNLQVGSSGNNVISLQKFLESKGFLTMPSGSSEGYLGGVTKKALIAFQASVGLPATGYCGSMTRSAISASK
jgi:peptidoglycan hydrolase-like protein with peptidoglycan-binding domain